MKTSRPSSKSVSKSKPSALKLVDTAAPPVVESSQSPAITSAPTRSAVMEVTLNLNDKTRRSTSIVYQGDGLKGSVRIAKSAFKDKQPPATLTVSSDAFAQPTAQLTKEEKAAIRKAQPKLTLAEKIAKREKQLTDMKARAAKEAAQPAAATL